MLVCCGTQLCLIIYRQFTLHLFQSASVSSGMNRMAMLIRFFHRGILLPLKTEMQTKCHVIQLNEWFYPKGSGSTSSGPEEREKKTSMDLQFLQLSTLGLKQVGAGRIWQAPHFCSQGDSEMCCTLGFSQLENLSLVRVKSGGCSTKKMALRALKHWRNLWDVIFSSFMLRCVPLLSALAGWRTRFGERYWLTSQKMCFEL